MPLKKSAPLHSPLKKKNLNLNSLYLHPPSLITSQLVLNANCPWNSTAAVNEMRNIRSLWTGSVHSNIHLFPSSLPTFCYWLPVPGPAQLASKLIPISLFMSSVMSVRKSLQWTPYYGVSFLSNRVLEEAPDFGPGSITIQLGNLELNFSELQLTLSYNRSAYVYSTHIT